MSAALLLKGRLIFTVNWDALSGYKRKERKKERVQIVLFSLFEYWRQQVAACFARSYLGLSLSLSVFLNVFHSA